MAQHPGKHPPVQATPASRQSPLLSQPERGARWAYVSQNTSIAAGSEPCLHLRSAPEQAADADQNGRLNRDFYDIHVNEFWPPGLACARHGGLISLSIEDRLTSCLHWCARLDLYCLDALRNFRRFLDAEVENALVQVRLNSPILGFKR
jgi:hypothetical protein